MTAPLLHNEKLVEEDQISTTLSGESMEEPENNCYCAGCGGKIQDSFQMKVLQDTWHNACFQCSVCSDNLTNWYYEKDGKLYCQKHYWEKFGELCHGCSLLMTGPAM
ncbi:LIM domain kinase 2, partial [Ataeniobius toweri]|nr:LIM domain kinase 2 [Ataeniobius toweri]